MHLLKHTHPHTFPKYRNKILRKLSYRSGGGGKKKVVVQQKWRTVGVKLRKNDHMHKGNLLQGVEREGERERERQSI